MATELESHALLLHTAAKQRSGQVGFRAWFLNGAMVQLGVQSSFNSFLLPSRLEVCKGLLPPLDARRQARVRPLKGLTFCHAQSRHYRHVGSQLQGSLLAPFAVATESWGAPS